MSMRAIGLAVVMGLIAGIAAYFGGFATVMVTWPLGIFVGYMAADKGWV